jgi:hypothetical protein
MAKVLNGKKLITGQPSFFSGEYLKKYIALIIVLLISLWNFGTPFGSVADENIYLHNGIYYVQKTIGAETLIPNQTLSAINNSACFAFNPEISAKCQDQIYEEKLVDSKPQGINLLHYPKIWFLATAWPSVLIQGDLGIIMSRVLASLICLLPILLGIYFWKKSLQRLFLALMFSLTPLATSFMGGYNPNSLEIASSVGIALFLFGSKDLNWTKTKLFLFGVTVMLGSIPKPWSGVWPTSIVFGYLLMEIVLKKKVVPSSFLWKLVGIVTIGLLTSTYLSRAAMATNATDFISVNLNVFQVTGRFLVNSYNYFAEYAGFFGWRDTHPAPWMEQVWLITLFLLVSKGFLHLDRRKKLGLFGLWSFSIILIPLLQFNFLIKFAAMGLQTRYVMPFFVLAIFVTTSLLHTKITNFVVIAPAILVVMNIVDYLWVLVRFGVGIPSDSFHFQERISQIQSGNYWFPPAWLLVAGITLSILYLNKKIYSINKTKIDV